MKFDLYTLWSFSYNEKPRYLFVTEQSDTLVAGYELDASNLGLASDLSGIFQLLIEEDTSGFQEELTKFKSNNLPFKRFKKDTIKKLKRM